MRSARPYWGLGLFTMCLTLQFLIILLFHSHLKVVREITSNTEITVGKDVL
jgi:hypothetical protein